ncbi:gag protein [Beauveria bassiana ARSEF 2860]|uniref:Gag protein n=1 Tax=Beauveria bassiana (strain ARSEF 2860) TaxID=655819 RepID=J4VSP7_BEAB2|nr:gag protein [Beauveria bassiana ARSEF 2860]EJP61615.1 gag protein [Beauveria bassiana ARSEF 2860]
MDDQRTFTPALDQFGELRQTRSASEYAAQFRAIAEKLTFNDALLMEMFYRGLKDNVKDVICMKDRPETLDEYIKNVVQIDNQLYARRVEKRSGRP